MKSKKISLITVSYLVEILEEDLSNDDDLIDKITNHVCENKNMIVNGKEIILEWNNTYSQILEPNEMNCGKCSECGQWTTDREKGNAIRGLCNGATVNGNLLCDDCLPTDHRWAF